MQQSFVYVLFDTRHPDHWRYLGVSVNPERRINDHLNDSTSRGARKTAWISKVVREGGTVDYRVIEMHQTQDDAYKAEPWWIAHLRLSGHRLTNTSAGGEGWLVNPWLDPVVRAKMMQARQLRYSSKDFVDQVTEHWQAYWSDESNKTKQSERTKNSWQNPDYRLKVSLSKRTNYARRHGRMLEVIT